MTCSALAAAIASPDLPGAACIGRWELFDTAAQKDGPERTQALEICRRCPSLARCKTWAAGQKFTPGTVVAGMVISVPRKNPRPATVEEMADALVAQWRKHISTRRRGGLTGPDILDTVAQ